MTELPLEKLREHARDLEEAHHEPIQRVVAILIIAVTLLAAVVAFLQTQAGTRGEAANRSSQDAALVFSSSVSDTSQAFISRQVTAGAASDFDWLRFALDLRAPTDGVASAYSRALARAYGKAKQEIGSKVDRIFGDQYAKKAGFDYYNFAVDRDKRAFAAGELEKAAARERGGWASKKGRYIAVITIFAVALFLLGLTLTVPRTARKPFVWAGAVVAAAAAIWGIVIFSGSVPRPSDAAIRHYADGAAKLDVVSSQPKSVQGGIYGQVEQDMTAALAAEPDYRGAFINRGSARFHLDFLDPRGPQGSRTAAADWQRAVDLDPTDYVSWGDLGAARFWLDDYSGALAANDRAIALRSVDPIFAMNEALYLKVLDRTKEYGPALRRMSAALAAIPTAYRRFALQQYEDVVGLGERYRPKIALKIEQFNQTLLKIAHQIDVSLRLYGKPTPPHTDTTIGPLTFTISTDRKEIQVHFSYDRLAAGALFLYQTFIDGQQKSGFSFGPKPFGKTGLTVGKGRIVLTFTNKDGFTAGQQVRTEVYVDGNMLSANTVVVPK